MYLFQGECDAPAPVLVDDCDPLDFGDRTPDKLRALIRSGRRGEIPEERLGCLYSWRDEGGAYEAVLGERPYKKRPQRAVILDRPLWGILYRQDEGSVRQSDAWPLFISTLLTTGLILTIPTPSK